MQSFGPYFFKYFSVPSSFRKSIPSKVMSQLTDALLYHFFFLLFWFFFPSVYPALGGKNKCSTISLVFIKIVLYPKLLGHLFVILVFTCYWEGMEENTERGIHICASPWQLSQISCPFCQTCIFILSLYFNLFCILFLHFVKELDY